MEEESLHQVDPSWSEDLEVVFDNADDRRLSVPKARKSTAGKFCNHSRSDPAREVDCTGQKAVMEVPLVWSGDGISMKRGTSMLIRSRFPIAANCYGGLETLSLMRGRTGYSTASGNLSYHVGSCCRLGAGVSAGQGIHQAHIGGTWSTLKSHFSATLHRRFPTTRIPVKREVWKLNVSATREIDPRLSVRAACEMEPIQKDGPRYKMHIGLQSKTVHQWIIRYGWSNDKVDFPTLSLSLRPRLSSPNRGLNLFASWRGGSWSNWNVGGSLLQTGSKNSPIQLSVGLCHGNPLTNGLVWLFTWIQGDFTLRVPIELPSLQTGPKISWSMYPLQALYFSMLSRIIQDIVADVIGSVKQGHKDEAIDKERQLNKEKSKQEAKMQQEFMGRQAQLRMESERSSSGLVIKKALYYVEGREDSVWDVTIPLQFWVTDTRLVLPSYSKRNMLGFYDVESKADGNVDELQSDGSKKESANSLVSFLRELWRYEPNTGGTVTSLSKVPKLWIQYQLGNSFYELEVFDDEELVLPNADAIQVSEERIGLTHM
ncbi:hypothetical protein FisN_4Lh176 [Fistulifera solaris]|uniref:DnaJ-like protein C11 C-terminal domain-containing protein n=1 Tax=Fistulifera solaris TaxID=1519565 RepID=A0A1Z5JZP7_FISSO|nr:hypothetical protein FisN_4Lh176 [Fistulifera solaris]|eukprot:GAX19241.1 hypothetical protein FisN_4Lh176 [Fistulifera solaris]